VQTGYHYLQVYRLNSHGVTRLLFKGYVFIPDYSVVHATVEKDRRIKITTETVTQGSYNGNNGSSNYNSGPSTPPAPVSTPQPISSAEFNDIRNAVDKISFSSTKLSTAKNALNGKYVTSEQVAALVKLFTFESDKIELAKFCYDLTVDRSRYYLVNDSFSFPSSIDELNEFIKKQN
jgi:hypothetical protein